MRALPENIDWRQSIAWACEGNTWRRSIFEGNTRNKQLLYGLLPGFEYAIDRKKVITSINHVIRQSMHRNTQKFEEYQNNAMQCLRRHFTCFVYVWRLASLKRWCYQWQRALLTNNARSAINCRSKAIITWRPGPRSFSQSELRA